jgi:hypothetical protein
MFVVPPLPLWERIEVRGITLTLALSHQGRGESDTGSAVLASKITQVEAERQGVPRQKQGGPERFGASLVIP